MAQNKKIPLRKCIVTNKMQPKQALIRIVRNKEGDVFVDETGKKNGRGAYVTKDKAIIEAAKAKNTLSSQLKTKVPEDIYDKLIEVVEGGKHN